MLGTVQHQLWLVVEHITVTYFFKKRFYWFTTSYRKYDPWFL